MLDDVNDQPTRRLERLTRDDLAEEQARVYDEIVAARSPDGNPPDWVIDETGALQGPFPAMVLAPGVGRALQGLGDALRRATSLDDRARELAILVTATHWRSKFELQVHELAARQAGISDAEINAACGSVAGALSETADNDIVTATRQLLRSGDLDDICYHRIAALLGPAGVVELTTLVGYYSMLALQLRVFRAEPTSAPAGSEVS